MSQVQIIEVTPAEDGMRLDRWFKTHYPDLGHVQLQKLLRSGQVRLDGGRVKASSRIVELQIIRVPPIEEQAARKAQPKQKFKITEEDIELVKSWIIHQDSHLFVINKPSGLAAQGGSGTTRHVDGLLDALKPKDGERPRLVHRLDKDTSGVMLIARSRKAATFYTDVFQSKEAKKLYWALVVGQPKLEEGIITLPLKKAPGAKGDKVIVDQKEGKFARTAYRVLETAGQKVSWLAFQPVTGRTHQLRVHATEGLETPIVGDGKYGGSESFLDGLPSSKQMHLHARAIVLPNLSGGMLEVLAPPPEHFMESCRFLGFAIQPNYNYIIEIE
ncbi:MAG: RluA family pseudouridine synthase [Rhodospirillales bacterium]|jgi:23S rRNA pseudouridine955/2504/2580 synthase|tara:strand:- start:166 stop:1155 length:990 start_codon:yes stop_codon:yes gene_type:complete